MAVDEAIPKVEVEEEVAEEVAEEATFRVEVEEEVTSKVEEEAAQLSPGPIMANEGAVEAEEVVILTVAVAAAAEVSTSSLARHKLSGLSHPFLPRPPKKGKKI